MMSSRWLLVSCAAAAALGCGQRSSSPDEGLGGSGDSSAVGSTSGVTEPNAVEGKPCTQAGTLRCGSDKEQTKTNAVLHCEGVYQKVFECPGLQQCADSPTNAAVDCGGTMYAKSGAPCAVEGAQVCSFDNQIVQVCLKGVWEDGIHCPPSTCANLAEDENGACWGHWCANCGYGVGDHCDFSAGSVQCSTDLTKVLQCSNATTVVLQDCAATGQSCTLVDQDTISCQ